MKLGLQIGLGLFSLIPLAFAVLGIAQGAAFYAPGSDVPAAVDNQFRYLSAIYLLVTLLLWWIIPQVEKHALILTFVCGVIFIGGLARLISHVAVGPGMDFQFSGMIIELLVPGFVIWQRLVARSARAA